MNEDLYAILGVLPEAEDVVITAAYRALATRYHPDRWEGSPEIAQDIMCSINKAYEVLRNQEKRRKYDETRTNSTINGNLQSNSKDLDPAFESAITTLSDHWKIAIEFYPELDIEATKLAKYSTSLSYAYIVHMLESKKFTEGHAISESMIRQFLVRYFGTNDEIKNFAAYLIENENKDAVYDLNQYVSVVGTSNPHALIQNICKKYGSKHSPEIRELLQKLMSYQSGFYAKQVCRQLGYEVEEKRKMAGLALDRFVITNSSNAVQEFTEEKSFVNWVIDTVVPSMSR